MGNRHPLPPMVTGTKCVPVFIPDSPEYFQLLIFAIRKMCQQQYYERDENHTAKLIADNLKTVTLKPLIESVANAENCSQAMPIDCNDIEPCIETSETITNIITMNNQFMTVYNQTNISITETIMDRTTQEALETPLEVLPPPPIGYDCNYDALWSGCLSVINYLDTITVDFLEQITAANDQNERYSSWVKGLPFIGTLPIDEALEYTTYITQELENSYNAVVTLEFKQSIACEIFCLLKENCDSLSPQFLLDYLFYTRLGIDPITVATYSIAPLIGFPIELLLQGADMAIGMWGIAIWMTQAQANFYGGFGAKNLTIAYKTGLNSPDADWELLCDCPVIPVCGDVETNVYFGLYATNPPPSGITIGSGTTVNAPIPAMGNAYGISSANPDMWLQFEGEHCYNGIRLDYRVSGSGTGNITGIRFTIGETIVDVNLPAFAVGVLYQNTSLRFVTPVHGDSMRIQPLPLTSTKTLSINDLMVYYKD